MPYSKMEKVYIKSESAAGKKSLPLPAPTPNQPADEINFRAISF